jgi:hypothetical protein
MKVLHGFILIFLLIGVCSDAKSQACIVKNFTINLTDESGEIVKDAEFNFLDKEHTIYARWDKENNYYRGSFGLCASANHYKNISFIVFAKGFKADEKVIDLSEGKQNFSIRLKREEISSNNNLINENLLLAIL